ncbi:DNA alkylation repair protein [Modestobacter sp. VKM Ac-2977]|uniref:DNA alkylation repair protein n=1 Tax=Modestobacter sp. VKM Ac-2977 TaxID=3004131 RepID=UPI0022AB3335|nr:DNA alkylation repair protein [Modestobacter sp. VKM Ac-2977]MCZ2820761.1 DNA alkylation repair protein [Modestobacter sp. VKM Ac-2977]
MDELISPAVVARLRAAVEAVAPTRHLPALVQAEGAVRGVRLRERVDIVRDALLSDVPAGFPAAERVVLDVLDEPRFGGWMIWPTTEFIAARALETASTRDFDAAMTLLARLTVGLTGEFAVRELLNTRPERGLRIMEAWTEHDSEHVRRLATEGSRAYLPWAKRVPWLLAHPRATRGILDATYRDPAEYVRRSVANHLNDLGRVDPSVVTEAAAAWAGEPDANTPWVLRHGLRTLIKRADPTALALVGFTGDSLHVAQPRIPAAVVPWGGDLTFTALVTNHGETDATVAIDYSIGFQRANGSVSAKTFKLGSRRIAAGGSTVVTKTHSFRPLTTRTHYPGPHHVTVQANGVLSPPEGFVLGREGRS